MKSEQEIADHKAECSVAARNQRLGQLDRVWLLGRRDALRWVLDQESVSQLRSKLAKLVNSNEEVNDV